MEENRRRPLYPEFVGGMTKGESIAAWIYLPVHILAMPLLLSLLSAVWPDGTLSEATLNLFYYSVGVLYMLVFLRKYLRRGFDRALDHFPGFLLALITTYFIDLALSWAFQLLTMALGVDLASPPNNEAVLDMASKDYNTVLAMSVFLAPLVEEPLFRGTIFGSLRKKNRIAAYAVSAVLFALYHVWQYIIVYQDVWYLFYALNYIPVSLALAYAYERTDSIWAPIFFHMAINALTLTVLGG